MHHVAGIHHISVLVADTHRALGFYRDVLGLAVDPGRPDLGYPGAWLTVGSQQIHLLELLQADSIQAGSPHGGRDRHVALQVSDLTALETALKSAQISYSRSLSGRPALFCRDPDGNALEFIGSA